MKREFKREPLTGDETNKLMNSCDSGEEKLLVWGLLETGLRIDEYLRVRKEMIDWQARRITVIGKGKKRRVVPLSDKVIALWGAHFAINESVGIAYWTANRMLKKIANRAQISKPVTPHILRHTFACNTLRAGVSLASLQKILGHDRLETTAIYLNMNPEDAIREFREKVG